MAIDSSGNVGITAAAYLGFNGAGDASHSVGYNSGIDGAILRGQKWCNIRHRWWCYRFRKNAYNIWGGM